RSEQCIPCANDSQPQDTGMSPVRANSGALNLALTDLDIARKGLRFQWTRFYNNQTDFRGPLGYNWNHSLSWPLKESVDNQGTFRVSIVTEDGKVVWFVKPYYSASFVPALETIHNYTLTKTSNGGYILQRQIPGERTVFYNYVSYGGGYRL